MYRRDLFKADLDENYKAICSNKEPVQVELFGDDLTERLKTAKESKRAAQQLTCQKRRRVENHASSTAAPAHFLFQRRGSQLQGRRLHRKNHQPQTKNMGRKSVKQI